MVRIWKVDYEDLKDPSSHYPYVKPPPNYQEYYYSEMDYHYEQERSYTNYEPKLPHFSSYQEEYDDYYHDYPQPTYEEPQDSVTSKLDAIMDTMIEMKKKDELRDKSFEALVIQVAQLSEEVAQIRRDQEMLTNGTIVDGDVVEEVMDLPEQETECLNRTEDITPEDESEAKDARVHPYLLPMFITPTNKAGDEGPVIRVCKVVLQDIGQFVKK
ncbi:hypothetical protein HanRHA438_Chr14g0652341 [Helianthus annuus]|nr:hypothetical protein HanRHA438_Chr14g0652341 [Helianthus annuus]